VADTNDRSRTGATEARRLGRGLKVLGFGMLGLIGSTLAFSLGFDIEAGSATFALALAGGALVVCLRSLHRIVAALATPDADVLVERDLGQADRRALREERRRLLRALNELAFDHAMGKLSDEDYRSVREGYELRAVEVMRALETEPSLDPELARELQKRGLVDAPPTTGSASDSDSGSASASASASDADADAASASPARGCAECGGPNDLDARFCKHCGKELAA
jgi:hypothetical protein